MKRRGYEEIEALSKDEELKKITSYHWVDFWRRLGIKKLSRSEDALDFFMKDEMGKIALVDRVEEEIFHVQGRRVLDVGCGKGGLIISCALRDCDAVGIDIDLSELRIAKLRSKNFSAISLQLIRCDAKFLPFRNNSFDLVTATSVLEHVDNPERAVKEMVRVLKPEGYILLTIPSPSFPREAHYKVFYIPYLPKKLGKIYLRLRGFNPVFFVREVTYPYPSPSYVERLLSSAGMVVENLTEKEIKEKLEKPRTIQSKLLRRVFQLVKKLRLNRVVATVICYLDIYPGALILAKKERRAIAERSSDKSRICACI
jgi:ubiquinone/menaquinone biosynthesis C-methylase UbiE